MRATYACDSDAPRLVATPNGLALRVGSQLLLPSFADMLPRLKQANLERELLVRSAKPSAFTPGALAVDACAGLGEDALLLAAAGFRVLMFERNPQIAALLADTLRRARKDPELAQAASRMRLIVGDSIEGLAQLKVCPAVVVLDPMFPAKRKSAAPKKKFQLLHALEAPCDDEEALLCAAVAANPRKVLVKRPLKGPTLAGRAPSYQLCGKEIRYDVYAL